MFGGEWRRNVLRILRQGACPLLKCRVEKKTKMKRYKRHDTSVLIQIFVDIFEDKVQHTAREAEGRISSCLGENGDAVADP